MLPRSSLASVEEKIRAHRDREEHCFAECASEAEKSAAFGRGVRRQKKKSFAELLLGPDFEEGKDRSVDLDKSDLTCDGTSTGGGSRGDDACSSAAAKPAQKNWILQKLSDSAVLKINALETLSVSVPKARGGMQGVVLSSRSLNMLRGGAVCTEANSVTQTSWLDDSIIDSFISLLNSRSEKLCADANQPHVPSKIKHIFNGPRVRTAVLSSQFFTIWNRKLNGGYENVSKWRRKISKFSSVGIFMFPAFVNGNHSVLAIIDVDGQQFPYYDPFSRPDTYDVIRCAKEWMVGEVNSAKEGDSFHGLSALSWPVVYNPWRYPVQKDTDSCGVFVLYVAENIDRGVFPLFERTDIAVLRQRTILILSEGKIEKK